MMKFQKLWIESDFAKSVADESKRNKKSYVHVNVIFFLFLYNVADELKFDEEAAFRYFYLF